MNRPDLAIIRTKKELDYSLTFYATIPTELLEQVLKYIEHLEDKVEIFETSIEEKIEDFVDYIEENSEGTPVYKKVCIEKLVYAKEMLEELKNPRPDTLERMSVNIKINI